MLGVAAGARVQVFSQTLLRKPGLLQLEFLGFNTRPIPAGQTLLELLHNGSRLHVESVYLFNSCNAFTLPFYKIDPVGVIELYVVNPSAVAQAISACLLGRYVSE